MAREMNDKNEKNDEMRIVEELLSGAGKGDSVVGLEQTLLAVRSKKIRQLVVDEDFHHPGRACPNCGFMEDGEDELCLICGFALRPVEDIVATALERMSEQGGEVLILRGEQARRALESAGRIGALIHVLVNPPVRDSSNQRIIEKDGKIDRNTLRDETSEESFPASDPPASY